MGTEQNLLRYGIAKVNLLRLWERVRGGKPSEPQEQSLFCPMCKGMGTHLCFEKISASRIGLLRGYGNAICAPVAQAFIEAYLSL